VIRKALVESQAMRALLDAAIDRPPARVDKVAARNGLVIRRGVDLPSGQQAVFDDVRGEILVSARRTGWAERFSIAHELGHALMEHGSRACFEGLPSYEAVAIDEADTGVDFEAEADAFADELLIPKAWLRAAVIDDALTIAELRTRFEATGEVLFIALERHRLLNKVRV
jgi:Zn-dependent peptidase ImmA (M78 family)